jgi:hypothetical protein
MSRTLLFLLIIISCCYEAASGQIGTDEIRAKECVFKEQIYPDIITKEAILITPLCKKGEAGVYAFRKKGPHELSRLILIEDNSCLIVHKDSSSAYVRKVIEEFSTKNQLRKSEKKKLQQRVQDYIIDFKESSYIN